MPITVISVSGSVRHMRPLPSDSTTSSVPVSATAKLAPEIATLARRNRSRRCLRAAMASRRGSAVNSGSTPGISRRKISRISARLRWMAGTRMWEGRSPPSWTISSARSVSLASMPAASSASLSPISCVAMDLTLTTSVCPVARTRSVTMRLASLASRAQCTVPPRAVTCASNWRRCSSRRAMVAVLMASPARRSCSQSSSSATTAARLSRITAVACPRLRRSWVSASASFAAAGNERVPRRCPTPPGATTGIPRSVIGTSVGS
jgi:hypothetical protein